jgi:transposase
MVDKLTIGGKRRVISMEVWHTIQVFKRKGKHKKAIARELGISKNTVKRYWRLDGPPHYSRKAAGRRLDSFSEQIKEMVKKRFIGTRIHEELKALGYSGSISSVYRYMEQFGDDLEEKTTIRFETAPGHQMQYDWKEWTVPVGGKHLKLYFHQAILSFSRFKYIGFSTDIGTESIIRFLMDALSGFGGVPDEIVIDNPRQMITSHDSSGTVRYQDSFLQFLGIFGLKPDPCMTYRARTKGKVENPFYYLQEHFLRGLEVVDLKELESRLSSFMARYNDRIHSTTGKSPSELLKDEDLRVAPRAASFPFPLEPRKVSWDGYVHVDANRYPMPLSFAGQKVWLSRIFGRWIELFDQRKKLISRFDVIYEHGVTVPHPEHGALSKDYIERKARRRAYGKKLFLETFPDIGEAFVELAEERCQENAAYHLKRIVGLLSIYEKSAVEEAIRCSLKLGVATVEELSALVRYECRKPEPIDSFSHTPAPVAQRDLSEYTAAYGGAQCIPG